MTDEPQDPLDQAVADLVGALEAMPDAELREEADNLAKTAAATDIVNPARTPLLSALARIAAGILYQRTDGAFQDIADHEDEDYS